MPTVNEICHDFAKTTTISGFYFIAKYKSCFVKVLWVLITLALVAINVYQSYLCTVRFLSKPTTVTTILSHDTLTFPAVTFCSTNPYVSGRLTESTAPQLKQTQDDLKSLLYGNGKNSSRKKRTTTQACPAGWEQVDQSCYLFPNKTGNWSDAVNFCGALNSTLPIFRNMTDFFNFRIWWDNKTTNGQTWLGLTYDTVSKKWTWLNNCSFQFFPDFWHKYWNWDNINPTLSYYAKFNTYLWGNIVMKGAEPAIPTDSTVQIVCYQEVFDIRQSCFSYEKTTTAQNTEFLCSSGWWCANDDVLGQSVASAVNSDSCFCLNHDQQTIPAALNACESFGGFLSDIRSNEELDLLYQLTNDIFNNDTILANICPIGFTYFNQSCFWFSGNKTSQVTTSLEAETACQIINKSHAASVHSLYEFWVVYYLMMSDPTSINWVAAWDWGTFLGGYRPTWESPWVWTDGSPFDVLTLYQFPYASWPYGTYQPNTDLYLDMAKDSGLVGDVATTFLPFSCRINIQVFPVWINYMNNKSFLDCNGTCISNVTASSYYFVLNKTGGLDSIDATKPNITNWSICRKDRITTSDFCSFNPSCYSTTSTTTTTTPTTTTTASITTTTLTTTTITPSTTTQTSEANTPTSSVTTMTPSVSSATSPIATTTTSKSTVFQTTVKTTSEKSPPTANPTSSLPTTASIYSTLDGQTTSISQTVTTSLVKSTLTVVPTVEANGLGAISVAQEKMLYKSKEMSEDDLSKLSYTLSELLSICTYNGTACNTKNFKKSFYSNVGNCYTFNIFDNPLNVQSEAGANFGLSLILKLNISTYLLTSLSPGFLLVVHHQNESIFPDSQSMKVVVGYHVDISITVRLTSIQAGPFSNCIDKSENSLFYYSVEVCQRSCQQQYVTKQCGCADPSLPSQNGFKFCLYEQKMCVDDAKANSTYLDCQCPPNCKNILFTSTPTFTRTRKTDLGGNNGDSAAFVRLFYQQLSFVTYEQNSAYDTITYVSDLSNWFGLYLGFSAITIFEFIPFCFSIFAAVCQRDV